MANDRIAVDGERDGLAYFAMLENRVSQVNTDVLKCRTLMNSNIGVGIVFEPRQHVGLDIVLHKIDGAFFELQYPHHGVGNDLEDDTGEWRFAVEIIRIGFQGDFLARIHRLQHERARTWRRFVIRRRTGGHDAEGKLFDKGRVRRVEFEAQLVGAGLFDGREMLEQAAFGRMGSGIENRFESEFYVGRSERSAIVEAHAAA